MIVNIRGTNGSGKSTVMRRVMEYAVSKVDVMTSHQRKPAGYDLVFPGGTTVHVIGHYEIPNGGGDTLGDPDVMYALIRRHAQRVRHVLYEGPTGRDGVERLIKLSKEYDVVPLFLSTPADVCVASVRERGHSMSDARILTQHGRSARELVRLKTVGLTCFHLTRDEAVDKILQIIRTPKPGASR